MDFYDTLSGSIRKFVPQDPERITIYSCGPTVYGPAHIGNARPAVIMDVLVRLLRQKYGAESVVYARNYTDIDDKIIRGAADRRIEIEALTSEVIEQYERNMSALNVLPPNITPRATQTIPAMIDMIVNLVAAGYAYVAADHVFFDVSSHSGHGRLSGQDLNALRTGQRIEPSPYKRSPQDFVLWKPSQEDQPGWASPWGRGRPGWHIECSAMIAQHLGTTIDIHAGGSDLIFPHHEAEIAQSECAHGHPLAQYWLHNGMVTVDGQKMSKSQGNFITIEDALARAPGEAVRLALLGGHYRQPLDFSWRKLEDMKLGLDRLYRAKMWMTETMSILPETEWTLGCSLSNDLDTAGAIATLFKISSEIMLMRDKTISKNSDFLRLRLRKAVFENLTSLLGIVQMDPHEWFRGNTVDSEEIEAQVEERARLRAIREFGQADVIRQSLLARGIVLEDNPDGTTWRMI